MAEHLKYLSDHVTSPNRFVQILRELFYLSLDFFLWLLDFVYRMPSVHDGDKRPVVLVSGLKGSTWSFRSLKNSLVELGHPVYAVSFLNPLTSIRQKSQQLENYLVRHDIQDSYVIGHSLGGLAVFSMSYRGRDRIRKLFAVGVPFKGSFLSALLPVTPSRWQLTPFSNYMKSVQASIQAFSNYQVVFSLADEFIVPGKSARSGRFDDVNLPEFGHLNLIMGELGIEALTSLVEIEEQKDPRPTRQKTKSSGER